MSGDSVPVVRRSRKASFVFFFAGVTASGGVNLLTSMVGSVDESLVSFTKALWGVYFVIAAYVVSLVAGAKEDGERELHAAILPSLSPDERSQVSGKILGDVSVAIRGPIICLLVMSIAFVGAYCWIIRYLRVN